MESTFTYPSLTLLDEPKDCPQYQGQAPYPTEPLYGNVLTKINSVEIPAVRVVPPSTSEPSESYSNMDSSNEYQFQDVAPKQRYLQHQLTDDSRVSGSSSSSRAQLFSTSSLPQSQVTSMVQLSGNQLSLRSSIGLPYDVRKQRTKTVDLSHLYLLNTKDSVTLTQTNESVAHYSHKIISECFGDCSNAVLVPRLKALEMYRKNVKKSKDPDVLFQYAQYMLQTALTMDITSANDVVDSAIPESYANSKKQQNEDLKEQFLKEAKLYLTKLSVKGYKDAQYLLADAYSSGAFGKVNHKDAFPLFQSSAKHGHIEAAYRTAVCFEKGLGTTRDSRKCIEFLKFAASRNHPAAMFKLGLYSFHGRMGLPQDVNTKQNGIKWLSRAAARANELTCAAPYELAQIYEHGFLDIVIPDESYATELYVQAASLGHIPSTTKLGKLYEQGNEVVPQDTSLSVHYYTQAALKGDPEAMLGLCAWYLIGAPPAFDRDDREAFQWALKAAKKGYAKAQYTVGYFHENGKGCKRDIDMAYKWYECAAENNDARAAKKISARKALKKRNSNMFHFSFMKTGDNVKPKQTEPESYLGYRSNGLNSPPVEQDDISSAGSFDALNVITDDQSFEIGFDDPSFPSFMQRSLTPISRTNSSYFSEENPFQGTTVVPGFQPPGSTFHLYNFMSTSINPSTTDSPGAFDTVSSSNYIPSNQSSNTRTGGQMINNACSNGISDCQPENLLALNPVSAERWRDPVTSEVQPPSRDVDKRKGKAKNDCVIT